MNFPIDVALVSGRRPTLLGQTLESFERRLFRYFEISSFRVNLDPFGGSQSDHVRCREIIRDFFPKAVIHEPANPGFGTAVQHLWSNLSSKYSLHLEDDWILHEDVTPERIFPLFHDRTKQITFLNCHKRRKNNAAYDYGRRRGIYSLFQKYDYRKPLFTTSPSFIDTSFANICAELMNPKLDPEKQFYNGYNYELEHFSSIYRNRFLIGQKQPNLITDIGRQWREDLNIGKETKDGISSWSATT